jgi:hypothetical protein
MFGSVCFFISRSSFSSYRPFHHPYPKIPVRSSRTSENIEEKCSSFMAGFEITEGRRVTRFTAPASVSKAAESETSVTRNVL